MAEHNDNYFTIWYGVYNCRKRGLVYASAGHPPAVLLSPDRQLGIVEQRLKTQGFPIGMFPDAEYTNAYCKINSPSTLYIFSDGIYEIVQSDGSIWGLDKFINILKESYLKNQHELSKILHQIQTWCQSKTFEDDLSIIKINFD